MKLRICPVCWSALCSVLVWVIWILPAQAQSAREKLYGENFDDGVAQNWDIRANGAQSWVVDGGRFYGADGAAATYQQAVWDDAVYSFRFNPADMQGNLRVNFRASPSAGYALDLLRLGDTLYATLVFHQAAQGDTSLGSWEGMSVDVDYDCQIVAAQNRIQVYLKSGKVSLAAAVDSPVLDVQVDNPLPAGTIGFEISLASYAWVDDLLILGSLESATYFLSGRVYDKHQVPIPGAELRLYSAARPGLKENGSRRLDQTVSGEDGSFRLKAALGFDLRFYSIYHPRQACCAVVESRPAAGAHAAAAAWLEYEAPLWERNLGGNVFIDDRLITPTPTEASTSTPVPTVATRMPPGATPFRRTPAPAAGGSSAIQSRVVAAAAALLLIAASLGGFFWLIRSSLRRLPTPGQPTPRDPQPDTPDEPLPPPVPQLRLLRVWLSQVGTNDRQRLSDHAALIAGQNYRVHVQVPAVVPARTSEPVSAEALQDLTVVLFAAQEDFEFDRVPAVLRVPPLSANSETQRTFRPLRPGRKQMRVCAYYDGTLVQSAVIEAHVVAVGDAAGQGQIERTIDYVANATLSQMAQTRRPLLSIFTNQAADGTHWMGVYSAVAGADPALTRGLMHTFSDLELKERGRELRELFSLLQGGRPYRYQEALPLDVQKLARSENDLVRLALAGWKAFHSLFLARSGEVDYDRLPTTRRPGLISIARCRGESPTLPWAALYELRLDSGHPDALHLCPVFKEQLAANVWSPDGETLVEGHDLLDNPRACRELPQCPLKGTPRLHTVCPFGFWGMVHEIEQPVQLVTPTPVDQTPPELKHARHVGRTGQSPFLIRRTGDPLHLAAGIYPGIPDAGKHVQELRSVDSAGKVDLIVAEERDQVLAMLQEGDQHLYYFYCHGVVRGHEFRLLLGPAGQEQYLSAADLDPREARWQGELRPLVILNGCETMRLTPDLIHGFLGVLRQLGASGVVGTEVPVVTLLARPVGIQLVRQMLSGLSIGESFLQIRRHLLRQGNPLGLVYSFYAPAALHLHDPQDCSWCRLRHLV